MTCYHNVLAAAALAACGIVGNAIAAEPPAYIANALSDQNRPLPDRARDASRKPADIVAFAGVKPGNKVLEFMPGGGYYTRILSKVVGKQGHVYAVAPLIGPTPWSKAAKDAAAKAGRPEPMNPMAAIYPLEDVAAYDHNVTGIFVSVSGYGGTVPVAEQVDAVWTTDNYHDFHNKMPEALDMAAINKALFRDLKPGGTYFVIDHATAAGAGFGQTETLHRSDKEAVKAEIVAAGFVFDGESNLLANAGDDHTKIVFDPSLRGKTDQFVLKFKKPANAPNDNKRHKDADLKNFYGNTLVLGPMLRVMWHPDHTYQEFSMTGSVLTSGEWYADADGHICLNHQSATSTRDFIACHPFEPSAIDKKVGDSWTEIDAAGKPWDVSLAKGYVYN